jgi:hypothetical protein
MPVMQEDGKPLSHEFTVRQYGLLEQMLLSGLRQGAPNPDSGLSQSAKKQIIGFAGAIHGNLLREE